MTKKTLAVAAAAVCMLAAAAPAVHAQANKAAAPAPAAPASLPTSPAKKALVSRLVNLQKPALEVLARNLVEQPLADMRQPVLEAVQERVPEDKREATLQAIQGDFNKYLDEAVPIVRDKAVALAPSTIGSLFEARLTEDELKTLIAFFESPVSAKYAQIAPEAQNAMLQKLVAETRGAVEPKVRAVQQSVSTRLSAFAPAGAAPAASGAK